MPQTENEVTIIVEGSPYQWPKKEDISYEQVVKLEYPEYTPTTNINYSVKYERGTGNKPAGALVKGAKTKVKEGMIFSVTDTGQS